MNIELRDYFAGVAMQALITSPKFNGKMGNYVTDAYVIADAMIKERDRITDVTPTTPEVVVVDTVA